MQMGLDAIVVVAVVVFNGIFGLAVYLRNSKSKINIFYALMCLIASLWAVVNYISNQALSYNGQLFINRFAFTSGLLLVLAVWFFSLYFPQKSPSFSAQTKLSILFVPIVLMTALTPLVVKDVSFQADRELVSITPGSLYILYILAVLFCLSLIIMNFTKSYYLSKGVARNQVAYSALGILLASGWILLSGALIPALTDQWEISKVGSIGIVFFIGITGYAIIRHHLFDIRLVVARSVAYFLLLLVMGSAYILGVITLGGALFDGDTPGSAQQLYNITLILVLAFTLQPLRHFFEKITDKIFYRDHYDPQTLLSNLGTFMTRDLDLKRLSENVLNELTIQMRLTKSLLIVVDNNEIFYEANLEAIKYRKITLQELRIVGGGIAIRDVVGPEPSSILNRYGLGACVELRSNNELVGYLLLGEKRSGDTFNQADIKTIRILSHELAIAIRNARSYTQIQNFNRTLQLKVDEATTQLRDANEHLKELDQIKNEFLSMATHQLNTPLTVIDGYLSMMNDATHGKLNDEQREFQEKALHRVRGMKRMVLDFLNVSRMEVGTFALDPKLTDLNKAVMEEVNSLGPAASEREVLLQYIPPKHPVPVVEIDEEKTRQAVMNLVDNAIFYSPKGEVKVYLDSDDKNITFKVVDNGIGVPEAEKFKLFQKFSRADNAKRERPSGTGVGLYLVKKVVEGQNGTIIFESTEGKGSTFGFKLPVKTKAAIMQESKPPTPEEIEIAQLEAKKTVAPAKPKEKVGGYYKIYG